MYACTSIADLSPCEPAFSSGLIRDQLIHSRAEPGSMLLAGTEATEGDHRLSTATTRDRAAAVYPTALIGAA